MKNLLFSYLVICVIIGILLSENLIDGTNLRIYFLLLLFCLFINQLIKNVNIQIIGICLQFMCLGIILHQNTNTTDIERIAKKDNHNIHTLVVLENHKSSAKYLRYKVKNLTSNRISLLHKSLQKNEIYPNDTLIIYGQSYPLQKAKNPYQFDYSNFLKRKNITHAIYADSILYHSSNHQSWKKFVIQSKEKIRDQLEESGYSLETRSIISSMLLGDRSEITEELNQSYIATGVVHILSISGLHVVMIFIILQFILRPLSELRNGKKIKIIVALIMIWIFAFYVEMQPPVFRSALMITIYYGSELLKRPKNIYHTLSLSAFIILIFQPNYLFDIGFQLSFSAVFFIVWLHPIYKILYQPKEKIKAYFYDLSCTSISAQLGTLPFTTLYFNQFSGLFLLGNIFLVPASFLMIIGSIIAIILVCFDLNFRLYTLGFNWFIESCNSYIKWLSTYDFLVLKQVYISPLSAAVIFIILFALRPYITQRIKGLIFLIVGCLLVVQINRYIDLIKIRNSNEIILFHQYKGSIIGIRNGQNLMVIHDDQFQKSNAESYILRPYIIHNRIKNYSKISFDSVVKSNSFYKSKHAIYTSKYSLFIGENLREIPHNFDYILIRNSSFIPEKMENLAQIKRVIADGSNYPSYISELDSILSQQSDSIFWKTSEQGYYRIKF